ncbi:MAG TPA: substrate-binding domain-containing protein [Bryobacteraceae bacterium]|nr:substrate-binding domain-containing protein [Bryobacteraceae bacterium]
MPSRPRFTAALLLSAVLLSSCRERTRKLIGVVPKATSHLFFVSVHAGVDAAAKEFGVDVLWNGPREETEYSRQIEIVDSMIARRVDGLAISATDHAALVKPVQRAMQAGIPVSVFDSGLDLTGYVTFVATDNYAAGQTAARRLAELLHGHGQVAELMHKPGGMSTVDRERGFEDVIAKEYPAIQIVARQYGMADRAKSRDAAEDILTAHPGLDGFFASAEANSIGAIQAIRARGLSGKIKLVTFDSSDMHIEALKDGTIDVMLVQDPYRIGYEAVRSLAMKLNGQTPPPQIDLKVHEIRRADLGQPEVQALLFPKWRAEQP